MIKDIQFVRDSEGRKTAVLMPIEQYEICEELMLDEQLAQSARESLADEERIPWAQVKAELVAEGKIDA